MTLKIKGMKKEWENQFEFRLYDNEPEPTLVALTPDKTVTFGVTVTGLWHRDIPHQMSIFGINYEDKITGEKNLVYLCYRVVETDHNTLEGEWSMGYPAEADHSEVLVYRKIANFTDYDKTYKFKLGWENGRFVIFYYQDSITTQTAITMDDPGDPVRFQHPIQPRTSFGRRWGVAISLINE